LLCWIAISIILWVILRIVWRIILFLCTIDPIQCGATPLNVSVLSTLVTPGFAIDIDLLSLYDWLGKLLLLLWLLGLWLILLLHWWCILLLLNWWCILLLLNWWYILLLILLYLLRILLWNLLRGCVSLVASSAHLLDVSHFLAHFTLQIVCSAGLGQMSFPGTLGTLNVIGCDVIGWCVSIRHLIIVALCLVG